MLAAIDAGSNTLRLLIGKVVSGKVVPELYLRRICRLAGGFTAEKGLSLPARERTLAAFNDFAETCHKFRVTQIRAVGTAAFRQAINGEEFARKIRVATQLPLEIISGEREAEFMAVGVLSALDPEPDKALIVDIGGGSTELVLCANQKVLWSCSLPLGVVRLTEGYVNPVEQQKAIAAVLDEFFGKMAVTCEAHGINPTTLALVGTAGTVTTLAALDLRMKEYDWQQINNYTLSLVKLKYWQNVLSPMAPDERETLPGMETGRGDLIMAGIEIMLCLMQQLETDSLIVSDFGILEGLLLSSED